MQYLVYDIESIVDKKLLNQVMFAGEGLSDQEAYDRHVKEIFEERKSTFVSASFHIPVCLAAIAVEKDYSIQKIGLLGEGERTPNNIVQHFWDMYNKSNFVLVDFNGRGYDVRLMELWAYRLGISIHFKHFEKFGVRYRYSNDKQLDLCEALNNNMSVRYQGGLNLFAKMLGKPGKMDTKGDMVQELYEKKDMHRIESYCLGDALDTYFVFLRWKVVQGSISLDQERKLTDQALEKIKAYSEETGYLKDYIENFSFWEPFSPEQIS